MNVTIEYETAGARMRSFGEILLPVGPTSETGARCAAWRNLHESSASFFRFAGEDRKELSPRSVLDRLGETSRGFLRHLPDGKVFDGDQAILRYDPMRKFMLKVFALVRSLRMKAPHLMSCLLTSLGAFLLAGQLTLITFESGLTLSVPAGVVDLLSGRQSGKGREAHINADFSGYKRIGASGNIVTREDSVPVSGLALDGYSFPHSFDWTVKLDSDLSYLGKMETLCADKMEPYILRPSQAVISVTAPETRIARRLAKFYAPKEVLEGEINSMKCLLKDLGIDLGVFRLEFLNLRKLSALRGESNRNTGFPCLTTFFNGGIVELATTVEPFDEYAFLSFGGVQAILERPPESSYNGTSHDALLLHKGRLGQKPKAVATVVGFDYYGIQSTKNLGKRNTINLLLEGSGIIGSFL